MRSAYHWLLATTLVLPTLLPAQQPQVLPASTTGSCGFDDLHQQLRTTDAIYQQRMQRFEAATRAPGWQRSSRSLSTYKIPVVVHVMETGTGAHVPSPTTRSATGIRALNERFRKVAGTAGCGWWRGCGHRVRACRSRPRWQLHQRASPARNMTGNATYMASGVFRQSAGISDAALKALGRMGPDAVLQHLGGERDRRQRRRQRHSGLCACSLARMGYLRGWLRDCWPMNWRTPPVPPCSPTSWGTH
jgi:hypothetical protein